MQTWRWQTRRSGFEGPKTAKTLQRKQMLTNNKRKKGNTGGDIRAVNYRFTEVFREITGRGPAPNPEHCAEGQLFVA